MLAAADRWMPPTAGLRPFAGHHRIETLYWEKTNTLKGICGIYLTANLQPVRTGQHRWEVGEEKGLTADRARACFSLPSATGMGVCI